ncbi:MAG: helix-turn-helix transcriptional regulator [Ruminococcaceae bacterium]|nr:helix-turn-helix transcriptional regulator [Oscillospiraceae bacterium]
MTLGEKIQELRRRYGMSQDALAERLEVSRQAVSKWERDEAVPETEKIIRISQVFGVSTDYLLREEEPAPEPAPAASPGGRARSWERTAERLIRRHGYKAGFIPAAVGALLCVVALLVMTLMPNFGAGLFETPDDLFGGSFNSGVLLEGDVPPEVLEQIYGQAGSGMNSGYFGDDLYGAYQQEVSQMQNAFRGTLQTMSLMFGVPVMLAGIALIALGSWIIHKGKKLSCDIH